MSTVVVTAADAAFFHLVQGTIRSIRERPQGQTVRIGMFDLGCTAEQREWLAQHVDLICQPDWHYSFPTTAQIPPYFKGLLARPFLRGYFPGFQTYVWIDADAWVQEWEAVQLLIAARTRRGLAIVPEISRANCSRLGDVEGLFEVTAKWYGSHYGQAIGRKMANFPMINAGVFALAAAAPHWELWNQYLAAGVKSSCSNLADQLALNLVVFNHSLREQTEFLPPTCNWMCHCGLPAWDPDRERLVDPYLPHHPVGVLHLSGEKRLQVELESTRGERRLVSLCYPAD